MSAENSVKETIFRPSDLTGRVQAHRGRLSRLAILVVALASSCETTVPEDQAAETDDRIPEVQQYSVTPVQGPSWLRRLGLDISATQMGQRGGREPIPETARREPTLGPGGMRSIIGRYLSRLRSNREEAAEILDETFVLAGADLYRLNCRSCHGPDGEGAPPEIKSLVDPIRATSVELTLERMKKRGTPISRDMAEGLASQAEAEVRKRLENGGEKMPRFQHLRGDEIEALLGYLDALAGVPADERADMLVSETASRVGEHMVKGTCHICHDATGPGGGHMAMMQGIIPSLASFPEEESLSAVEHQVEYGSSGMMGMMMHSNTMPALPFLTEEEVAAGYFYLAEYSPQP